MGNKVLITGIEGFVGDYLRKELEKHNYDVFGTYFEKKYPKSEYMDIKNINQIKKTIKKIKPDYVVHLAGFSSVGLSWKKPEEAMQINAKGTHNLLTIIKSEKNVKRTLIISSSEIYGKPKYLPLDLKHPLNGINPYAISRIRQEEYVKEFKSLDIMVSRSFNHTGPGRQKIFVCSDFAYQISQIIKKQKKPEISHGNLGVWRDFTDVRDVVRAYRLILEKGVKNKTYNVCSGKMYKIEDVLNELIKLSNIKIKTKINPDKYRPVDVEHIMGDYSELKKDTGWKPEISFIEKTIPELLQYWIEKK